MCVYICIIYITTLHIYAYTNQLLKFMYDLNLISDVSFFPRHLCAGNIKSNKCFPCKCEDLSLIPRTHIHKLGMLANMLVTLVLLAGQSALAIQQASDQ